VERVRFLGGRYRLIEPLGTGGMSVVWRAFDEVLARPVAVKLLAQKFAADPRSRARIRAEAQAAARLSHPHIAAVYDYGESTVDEPFVVMELVDGEPLDAGGPLAWPVVLAVCAQVAAALATVHARGLVHRDIKPANVLLTANGAKVVDFGISTIVGDQSEIELLGTPAYVAPERLSGAPSAPATDVYALGLLLYKLLTGDLPWPAKTPTEMLNAHLQLEPPPLPPIPGLPAGVSELCLRCLAKSPSERPSAEEVARELCWMPDGVPVFRSRLQTAFAAVGGLAAAALLLATCSADPPPVRGAGVVQAADAAVASAPPRAGCQVQYRAAAASGGTFAGELTVINTGSNALAPWQVGFRVPDGHVVGRVSAGTWRQQGTEVMLSDPAHPSLAAGATVTVAVGGQYGSASATPTGFALNGVACQQVSVTQVSTDVSAGAAGSGDAAGDGSGDAAGRVSGGKKHGKKDKD
jgi:serine/threonine-protein kinase